MMIPQPPLLIFSTPRYQALGNALCASSLVEEGHIETRLFPDGERYQRIAHDPTGRDVVLLGGTVTDEETLRIFDLACALVKYGARTLTLIIPYFGYSTMERAVKDGEVVTAKTRARLFSAIPAAPLGNRAILVDLHAPGIPYYFEDHIRTRHLYAKPVIIEAIRQAADGQEFVLACTDAGRAKWVESLANDMGVTAAYVFKRRISGSQTEVSGISAEVQGRPVVIYDDMIRSGSTLLGAAAAYRDAGATAVSAVTTHGLFPGNALDKLQASGLLTHVASTDTHPRVGELMDHAFLRVFSIAGLLKQCLEELHKEI